MFPDSHLILGPCHNVEENEVFLFYFKLSNLKSFHLARMQSIGESLRIEEEFPIMT